MPRTFIVFSWLFVVLFLVSAGLQINDPDPARWIAFYVVAALAGGLAAIGARRSWIACAAVAAVAACWGAVLLMQVWGKVELADAWRKMGEKGGMVEVEREAGGLLIAFSWLAFSAWFLRRAGR